jgi:hypothetical protein
LTLTVAGTSGSGSYDLDVDLTADLDLPDFAMLGLAGTDLDLQNAEISGDISFGPDRPVWWIVVDQAIGNFSTDNQIDGNMLVDASATTYNLNVNDFADADDTQITGLDMAPAVNEALAASSLAASLEATQSYDKIGNGGINVIDVVDVDVRKNKILTISGGESDVFIFNIANRLKMGDNAKIVLDGVDASQILWNVETVDWWEKHHKVDLKVGSELYGTILATDRSAKVDGATIHGALIAGGDGIDVKDKAEKRKKGGKRHGKKGDKHNTPTINAVINFVAFKLPVLASAAISGDATASEGSVYTLNLSVDGITATKWSIDWGDGTIEDITGNPSSLTHVYADDGSATITAIASDGTIEVGDSTGVVITAVDRIATLSGGPDAFVGADYTLNLSSVDPGADTVSQWSIDWGDGSAIEVIVGDPSSATHVYAAAGDYIISASVTDEDGTYAANTLAVTGNTEIVVTGPPIYTPGVGYTLMLDAKGLPLAYYWTINWGDGTGEIIWDTTVTSVTYIYADEMGEVTIIAAAQTGIGDYTTAVNADVSE